MEELLAKYGENFRTICSLIAKKMLREATCRDSDIFDCEELTA